jgi:hypothetical protein
MQPDHDNPTPLGPSSPEDQQPSELPTVIPPMIERSQQAFRRALPELMKKHYMKWVAFHGDEMIGIGRSKTQLYLECLRRGLQRDEFVVRGVEPEIDEDGDIGFVEFDEI